ncbi:hypothetical protein K443DRAFT_509706 [Laccaria amethystina LaAM-08-1]|uniref:Uncharacterized protein n=1 Tax=Laccaria amethystina LaAM-08-1 TaxID=1095629 RepID=A0A0C9XMI2_9AGAR|nr:hypothetical protein K443DRAFT_509706 [Laccaria amethystina LaAM-08-1]
MSKPQFSNLDPPSRPPDCACSTASSRQRDRLPSFSCHPYSRLRSSRTWDTIGTTDFWLRTPIRPLLGSLFLCWRKGTPNECITPLPVILRVPRENGT